jgi:hypothetical protein
MHHVFMWVEWSTDELYMTSVFPIIMPDATYWISINGNGIHETKVLETINTLCNINRVNVFFTKYTVFPRGSCDGCVMRASYMNKLVSLAMPSLQPSDRIVILDTWVSWGRDTKLLHELDAVLDNNDGIGYVTVNGRVLLNATTNKQGLFYDPWSLKTLNTAQDVHWENVLRIHRLVDVMSCHGGVSMFPVMALHPKGPWWFSEGGHECWGLCAHICKNGYRLVVVPWLKVVKDK